MICATCRSVPSDIQIERPRNAFWDKHWADYHADVERAKASEGKP